MVPATEAVAVELLGFEQLSVVPAMILLQPMNLDWISILGVWRPGQRIFFVPIESC